MPKQCRHVGTAGKGETGAPCSIEVAATDSSPLSLEFGGGEAVERPEHETSQTHHVHYGSIQLLSLLCSGRLTCSLGRNACILYERPAKCNTTKPSLMKEGIGFGSSLYRLTWFGVPCNDL